MSTGSVSESAHRNSGFLPKFGNIPWSKPARADFDGEPPSSQQTTPQTLIYSG